MLPISEEGVICHHKWGDTGKRAGGKNHIHGNTVGEAKARGKEIKDTSRKHAIELGF